MYVPGALYYNTYIDVSFMDFIHYDMRDASKTILQLSQ